MSYINSEKIVKSKDSIGCKKQGESDANYYIFNSDGGEKLLQINTYGSQSRKFKDKASQMIQMNSNLIKRFYDDMFGDELKASDKNAKQDWINKIHENKAIIDFNVKEAVDHIYQYISSKDFSYDEALIKNLYISLKSKPFVILSGISGTGKSKIIELFAEAMGATADNGRFRLISVKPDWSDGTDLIGYKNIAGKFICGQITKAAFDACNDENHLPYFVCLDEMNLARVEYYFSDILSKMETRKFNEAKEIVTNRILDGSDFGTDNDAASDYEDIYIPDNLYIVGTVNMDETTFPFSRKVLDRANTIEFNKVDLDYSFDDIITDNVESVIYPNKLLKSEFLNIRDCIEYKEVAKKTIEHLKEINDVLKKYNDHFGYRVRDEIVFYMIYALRDKLFDFDEAFNLCIVQKILPKINGSSRDTLDELIDLYNLFNSVNKINDIDLQEEDIEKLNKDGKYRDVNEKLIYMMRRFVRDGFTTFWN